jgi:starch phosphorylase
VDLAGLKPEDVRVEAVLGRVGPSGRLVQSEVVHLAPAAEVGSAYLFSRQLVPQQTGRLGFTVRVAPNHYDDPLTRPCNAPLRWAGDDGQS